MTGQKGENRSGEEEWEITEVLHSTSLAVLFYVPE